VLHAHVKLPVVSVHVARLALQLCDPAVHSLTLVHETPESIVVQPALHAHVKLPAVLVQIAVSAQLSALVAHSSTSVHVVPSPL
jgi:hypothetical protein